MRLTRLSALALLAASFLMVGGAATAGPRPKPPPPPPQPADLALMLTDTPDPYIETVDRLDGNAEGVTYFADVTNRSTSKATNVTLDVDFSVGDLATSAFYIGSVNSSQGTCTKTSTFGSYFHRDILNCAVGEIAAGDRAVIEIHVYTCGGTGPTGGRGSVKGAEPDPEMSNNSAYQETLVEDSGGLCVAA